MLVSCHYSVHNSSFHTVNLYRVICGLLKNKLVVLVTHQVQFAQQASKILAIKDVSGSVAIRVMDYLSYSILCSIVRFTTGKDLMLVVKAQQRSTQTWVWLHFVWALYTRST